MTRSFPWGASCNNYDSHALEIKGVKDMLALIAAVLIVLWLLGFFAFHVSAGVIHILLIIGIVMLVLHFLRGRAATA
jgi:hypothetical protein